MKSILSCSFFHKKLEPVLKIGSLHPLHFLLSEDVQDEFHRQFKPALCRTCRSQLPQLLGVFTSKMSTNSPASPSNRENLVRRSLLCAHKHTV